MDSEPRYRIAINDMALSGKLPPGDPRWATFNDSFRNLELPCMEIANAIYTGHAYTNWHAGRRKLDNFQCSQYLAVDMDTDDQRSAFDTLLCHDLVIMYAGLLHTTPSHTAAKPRARIIFLLDQCIMTAASYETAARFLVAQFDGADLACVDGSRFFYGAPNCDAWTSDHVLPLEHLRRYYRQWKRSQPAEHSNVVRMDDYRQSTSQSAPAEIVEPVLRATNGNRNNTLNRQAYIAGCAVARGHVSQTEIEQRLMDAARAIQLGETEARLTIRSGMIAGIAKGA
jgi:hypothetical protein